MREGPSVNFLQKKQTLIVLAWLLTGPVAPGERSTGKSRFAGRTRDPMGDPSWSSLFLKVWLRWECLWRTATHGKDHTGALHSELPPVAGTPRWSQGRKEQQRQHVANWPQPPFLILLCHCVWENRDWSWSWEGWRGGKKGVLRFVLISPFPTDLVGNKLN